MGTATEELTREQLLHQADELAHAVMGARVGHKEAFLRLDQGEHRGTIFASKMAAIRFLLGPDESLLSAAE